MSDDIDVLESVLAKATALLAGVTDGQFDGSTPCPDYDVRTLVNHIVGWAQVFAASANERKADIDVGSYEAKDPAGEFGAAAKEMVAGWREHGVDRDVTLIGNPSPGAAVLGMTLMEYVTHGWDLATATGQPVPFSDEELQTTLERAQATLPDQYRGEGKPFAERVDVPDGAPVLHRLVGFMGRRTPA